MSVRSREWEGFDADAQAVYMAEAVLRQPDLRREVWELRDENAVLRAEIEALKGQGGKHD